MAKLTNQSVIAAYVNGTGAGVESHTGNLWVTATGDRLMNYSTCLIERVNGKFIVNETKYSVTTSKIQTYIYREMGSRWIAVNNVPQGSSSLERFVKDGVL
jgi:hypothetical protein